MGTLGHGLIRLDNGKATYYRMGDGLYDSSIYAILRDRSGNFWFGFARRAFSASPNPDLDLFAQGKIQRVPQRSR